MNEMIGRELWCCCRCRRKGQEWNANVSSQNARCGGTVHTLCEQKHFPNSKRYIFIAFRQSWQYNPSLLDWPTYLPAGEVLKKWKHRTIILYDRAIDQKQEAKNIKPKKIIHYFFKQEVNSAIYDSSHCKWTVRLGDTPTFVSFWLFLSHSLYSFALSSTWNVQFFLADDVEIFFLYGH